MKRGPASYAIREMQVKATQTRLCTPLRTLSIQTSPADKVAWQGPQSLLVGKQNAAATLGKVCTSLKGSRPSELELMSP